MAMSINAGYFARESLQNFRRNWVMSFGAVITIYLSLLLVGIFLVFGVLVNTVVKSVERKVSIQVFLKDGAPTADVNALQRWLLAEELVKSVEYTSKTKALERFKEEMKQSPEIVEQLDTNPLPASLDVTLKDPRTVETMVNNIKAQQLFKKVADRPNDPEQSLKYGQQVVRRLFAFTKVLRYIGVIFIVMLIIVSLIFISNTIRLAIYARRKEIGIMRLVGASNWFIRTPFLMEGVLQAFIGAGFAILTIAGLEAIILPRLGAALPFLPVEVTASAVAQIALILILVGLFIGLLGSGLALRRYLKV